MKIEFRQGVVSYQSGGFLQKNGSKVDILAANKPVTITIAQQNSNYRHSEDRALPEAWTGFTLPAPQTYWLYWDFNVKTFFRTFGWTIVPPVYGLTAPPHVIDQHWYDTSTNTHFVSNGITWTEVVRVFAARYDGTSFFSVSGKAPDFAGSQIGNLTDTFSGRVLHDESTNPIRKDDGTFFTTEDQFFTNQARVDGLRFEANVQTATLTQNASAFSVVAWIDDGTVALAKYDDIGSTVLGMLTEGKLNTEVGGIIVQGTVTNPDWTWLAPSTITVGATLWVDNTGQLVDINPHVTDPLTYPVDRVPIARVLSNDTIIFEQGLGGIGPRGPVGDTSDLAPATTTDIGVVTLVSPSSDPLKAFVISDLDPRLTDARQPLLHFHSASDVLFQPGAGLISNDVQAALLELGNTKIDVGATLNATLWNNQSNTITAALTGQTFIFDQNGSEWKNGFLSAIRNTNNSSNVFIDSNDDVSINTIGNLITTSTGDTTLTAGTTVLDLNTNNDVTLTGNNLIIEPITGNSGIVLTNGSSGTTIIRPNSSTVSTQFILPNDNGLSNYVLSTDGSGATSWIQASGIWGSITGTLSDQLDLQSALNLKTNNTAFISHTGDTTVHFVEANIDHLNIGNIGTNSHDQIDTHIAGTALNHLATDITYDNSTSGLLALNTQTAIDENVGNIKGRMKWLGNWVPTTLPYAINDTVRDGNWTMIRSFATGSPINNERPSPQPNGVPENVYLSDPTWITSTPTASVRMTQTYVTAEAFWVPELRIWPTDVSASVEHRVFIVDKSDPLQPVTETILLPALVAGQWNVILSDNRIFKTGSIIEIVYDTLNSGADTTVAGSWTKLPDDDNIEPAVGEWILNTARDRMRVHVVDSNAVDRSVELSGVTTNTDWLMVQTNDTTKSQTYLQIDATVIQGSPLNYIEFDVLETDIGSTDRIDDNALSSLTIKIPVPQPTSFNQQLAYWNTGSPQTGLPDVLSSVVSKLELDGIDQPETDSAMPIDFKFQRATLNPDWEIVALSGGSGSGGGGGGSTTPIQDDLLGNGVSNVALSANQGYVLDQNALLKANQADLVTHTSDATIHFTQAAISITESQISDLQSYELANVNIQAHIADITGNPHSTSLVNLSDTLVPSPVLNDVLTFNGAQWINQVLPSVVTDHTLLTNIGTNTHAQIDTHMADGSIHFPASGLDHDNILNNGGAGSHATIILHMADTTLHFTEGSISHLNIGDIGTNSHVAIDNHIGAVNIHYIQTDIDHAVIQNIGTNSHAAIDSHIADTLIHFNTLDGLTDVQYVGSPPVLPNDKQTLTYNALGSYWEPVDNISAVWGNITGTLSDQIDLQAVLDTKFDGTFNVIINDGIGFETPFNENILSYQDTTNGLVTNGTFITIGATDTFINIDSVIFNPLVIKNNTPLQSYDNTNTNGSPSTVKNLISRTGTDANTPPLGSPPVPGTYNNEVILGDAGVVSAIRDSGGFDPVIRVGAFGTTDDFIIYHAGNFDPNSKADKVDFDSHVADTSIHFNTLDGLSDVEYTGSPISPLNGEVLTWNDTGSYWEPISPIPGITDHTGLTNIGTNTHAQLDTHLADATIHFTEASIVHQNISGSGTNTHAQLDTHLADATIHFSALTGLSDVTNITPLDKHVLIYNFTNTQYENRLLVEADISNLGTYEPAFTKNTAFNKDFGTAIGTVAIGNHLHAGVYEPANTNIQTHISDNTIHFTEASIVHQNISGSGTNTHAQLDTHLADSTIHFTEASIVHQNISGAGTNTHLQIDNHLGSVINPHSTSVSNLTDTTVSAPNTGHYLRYNASTVKWENTLISENDIVATSIKFEPRNTNIQTHIADVTGNPHSTSMVNLTDTTITAPVSTQVVRHDGTNWKNAVLTGTDVSNTPFGTITATNTQAAINDLETRTTTNTNDIDTINTVGPVGYTHFQNAASITWSIPHNRNSNNLVYIIIDNLGKQIIPDNAQFTDLNTLTITFSTPVTGRANIMFYKT